MKRFLKMLFALVMVITAYTTSFAQTIDIIVSDATFMRFISNVYDGEQVWSASERWSTKLIPNSGDLIRYRTNFDFKSNYGRDNVNYAELGLNLSPRINLYTINNHQYLPRILKSTSNEVLTIQVTSNPDIAKYGLNLVAMEDMIGVGGGFHDRNTGEKATEFLTHTIDANLAFEVDGTIGRAAIKNNAQAVLTFADNRVIDATMLGTTKESGLQFNLYPYLGKVFVGGDIVINSQIKANGQTVEFSNRGSLPPVSNLATPTIYVGGSATNSFERAIVGTDVVFQKVAPQLSMSGTAPELIIEKGATLTLASTPQVSSNTSLIFRNPAVSSGLDVPTCNNLAGTLVLKEASQSFGAMRIERRGTALSNVVIDFGSNASEQVLSVASITYGSNIANLSNTVTIKNYGSGDHFYVNERPSDEILSRIIFEGFSGTAGLQDSGDLGWEILPDTFMITATPSVIGENTQVTLTANTTLTPIIWEYSSDGGKNFAPIEGATSDTYEFTASLDMNNYRYRCQAGSGADLKVSTVYLLNILEKIVITKQPSAVSTNVGKKVEFSVTATGSDISYQWYYSKDNGQTWTIIDGATSSVYNFTPTDTSLNNALFRCELTSPLGTVVRSSSAGIVVVEPIVIVSSPANSYVLTGDSGVFNCVVKNATTGVWQILKNGSSVWQTATDGTATQSTDEEGNTVFTYTVKTKLTDYATATNDHTYYRCALSNGITSIDSDSGELRKYKKLAFVVYPESWTVDSGGNAVFSGQVVCHPWTELEYKWSFYLPGLSVTISQASYTKTKGNIVSINESLATIAGTRYTPTDLNNAQVFCEVKQARGTNEGVTFPAITENLDTKATLTVTTRPVFSLQPKSVYATPGHDVTFSSLAAGAPTITYQWFRKLPNGSVFEIMSGQTSPNLELTNVSLSMSKTEYRCEAKNSFGTTQSAIAKLIVNEPVDIDDNYPADVSVGLYGNASFKAVATGTRLTYQWYESGDGGANWIPLSGATTASYSMTQLPASKNGYMYYCEIIDHLDVKDPENISYGATRWATLSVASTPIILQQPENGVIVSGDPHTFSVNVSGGKLKYQWEVSKNGGVSWEGIIGASSSSYKVPSSTLEMNGWLYRCIISVTGENISVTSNSATLTVTAPVFFTKHPTKTEGFTGTTVSFSVESTCVEPNVTYQWQISYDGGQTWTNFMAPNGSHITQSLSFAAAVAYDNTVFRCVAKNYVGIAFYSNPAILWVYTSVGITKQIDQGSPTLGQFYAVTGKPTSMSISTVGATPITYKWYQASGNDYVDQIVYICNQCGYVYDDSEQSVAFADLPSTWICPECGAPKSDFTQSTIQKQVFNWQLIRDVTKTTGATGDAYSFTPNASMNGYYYYCEVSNNGGSASSNPVSLEVRDALVINTNPVSGKYFVGESVTLSASASGDSLSYQWYVSYDFGATWVKINGAIQPDYTFTASTKESNASFYCSITSGIQTITTSPIIIGVYVPPTISPETANVIAGSSVTFKVTNAYNDLTYQWYSSSDNVNWTKISGATSTSYKTPSLPASSNKMYYRCESSTGKATQTSATSVITIYEGITITTQPQSVTVKAGSSTSLFVESTGNPSYQWQKYDGRTNTWTDLTNSSIYQGVTTSKLSIPLVSVSEHSNYSFRCRLFDASQQVVSAAALISVTDSVFIDIQPVGDAISYVSGDSVVLKVTAHGDNINYQWQIFNTTTNQWENVNYAGSTTDTLTIPTDSSLSGEFRCLVSNAGMSVTSHSSNVTIIEKLEITASQDIAHVGGSMTLSCQKLPSATYQWQVSTDSTNWTNIGTNSASLNLTNLAKTDSGNIYRCVVITKVGEVVSNTYILTVLEKLTITKQPSDVYIRAGYDTTLSIEVSGDSSEPILYQWQKFDPFKSEWYDVDGQTSSTYFIENISVAFDNVFLRCIVSDRAETLTSDSFKVVVSAPFQVTPSTITCDIGATATFEVLETLNYPLQWQESLDGGLTWTNIAGKTSPQLTISPVLASQNMAQYRCAITTDIGLARSSVSTLLLNTDVKIISQPQSLAVDSGNQARFAIAISGNGTYQWQSSFDNVNWTPISGATSYEYIKTAQTSMNGTYYRCMITTSDGIVFPSYSAKLTVKAPITIEIGYNPDEEFNLNTIYGTSATLSVIVQNPPSDIVYDWQTSSDMGVSWTSYPSGNGLSSLRISNITRSLKYRCVVSNGADSQMISKVWTIDVYNSFAFLSTPLNPVIPSGEEATFTATVSAKLGSNVSFTWQIGSKTYVLPYSQSHTSTITLTAEDVSSLGAGGNMFIKASCEGTTITSSVTKLTVSTRLYTSSYIPPIVGAIEGSKYVLTCNVSGASPITYQWYSASFVLDEAGVPEKDSAGNFQYTSETPIQNAKSRELELDVKADMHLKNYYCVATNIGGEYTTAKQVLFVTQTQSFSQQPKDFTGGLYGNGYFYGDINLVNFTTDAEKTIFAYYVFGTKYNISNIDEIVAYPTITWQVSYDNGLTWYDYNIQDNSFMNMLVLSNLTRDMNGNLYRMHATNTSFGAYLKDSSLYWLYTTEWDEFYSDSAKLTVANGVVIYSNPTSINVTEGSNASFTVTYNGGRETLQWQYSPDGVKWYDINSATSSTYSFKPSYEYDGYQFRCIIINAGGAVFSNPATLGVAASSQIIKNPELTAVEEGSVANISIEANSQGNISYQWQVSYDGGATWTNFNGDNNSGQTANLHFVSAEQYDNAQFRCQVYSKTSTGESFLSSTSSGAFLHNIKKTELVSWSANVTTADGASAVFWVNATGKLLTYQWQVSEEGNWTNISGATRESYTIASASYSQNGNKYRCVVYSNGVSIGVADCTLSVVANLIVDTTPTFVEANEGTQKVLSFDVLNATSSTTYKWEVYKNNIWQTVNSSRYRVNKNTLTISNVEMEDDNLFFRCTVNNGTMSVTTGSITVYVFPLATVTTPSTVTAKNNSSLYIISKTTGKDISYKWYLKTPTGVWTELVGKNSSSLYLENVTYSQNGNQYACVVSNVATPFVSPDAQASSVSRTTLNVTWSPSIVTDCKPVTVYEGEPATFTVLAEGQPTLNYQWCSYKNGVYQMLINQTSPTLTIQSPTIDYNGTMYYCYITNGAGEVYSSSATLTVKVPVVTPATVKAGQSADISVVQYYEPNSRISYQWQVKSNVVGKSSANSSTVWTNIDGATSQKMTLDTVSYSMSDNQYRCIVTGQESSAESEIVTLSVGDTYMSWATENGLESDSELTIQNGGGLTNFEKYVFGLNADKVGSYASIDMKLISNSDGTTTVRFPVAIYVTDAVVGVEYSKDLINWTKSSSQAKQVQITETERIYEVVIPESSSNLFVRFNLLSKSFIVP